MKYDKPCYVMLRINLNNKYLVPPQCTDLSPAVDLVLFGYDLSFSAGN